MDNNLSHSDLHDLTSREWLAVNQLGGYSSSSICGMNTRKYHGLLVAAMSPPVRRMVILSRVEETVLCDGWSTDLACNDYPGAVFPRGDQSLRAFDHRPFPRWAYQGDGWRIEKMLRLLPGKNAVVLTYTLIGGDPGHAVELQLKPLFALRPIHDLTYQWNGPTTVPTDTGRRIPATGRTPEVFFSYDGVFEPAPNWYLNTIYRREQERGYGGLEDLWNPGLVRWSMTPGQSVHFVCSTDPIDLPGSLAELPGQCTDELTEPLVSLLSAACQFVLDIPSVNGPSQPFVAASYPWSPPSPRYALIGFTGLFLVPKKFDQARRFLMRMVELLQDGLLPSSLSESGGPPIYQGVDVSLWFVNAVHAYFRYTTDLDTVAGPLLDAVDTILHRYRDGTLLGIEADVDGLLTTNQPGVATTWMDAQADGWVVTPRGGKAVEVNALWYNAVRIAAELHGRFGHGDRSTDLLNFATTIRTSFNRRFWNPAVDCCYDVWDEAGGDPTIRPNQLLAVSLPFAVLSANRFESVLEKVRGELLTPMGLRTMARGDNNYRGTYAGDVLQRDRAYHQGSVFPWLLGPFVTAYKRVHGNGAGARAEAAEFLGPAITYLRTKGTGQLPELFDGNDPHRPGGATAHAAAVAEVLRAYVEDVLDVLPTSPLPTTASEGAAVG